MLCTDINMVTVTIGRSGLNFMSAILGLGTGFVNGSWLHKTAASASATAAPAALQAKLTQSLSSHFKPRM